MNRWDVLIERIHGYCLAFAGDPAKSPPEIGTLPLPALLEMYFDKESRRRQQIDSLARRLAATGTLPEVQGWDALLFYMRLECAVDFLAQLLVVDSRGRIHVPAPGSDSTDAELIEWLLIELWYRRGDHWLKLVAQSRALNRPFYGLDDAF